MAVKKNDSFSLKTYSITFLSKHIQYIETSFANYLPSCS